MVMCKGMWRGVTPVSMLRVYLTVTGKVTCLSFGKFLPKNLTNH